MTNVEAFTMRVTRHDGSEETIVGRLIFDNDSQELLLVDPHRGILTNVSVVPSGLRRAGYRAN